MTAKWSDKIKGEVKIISSNILAVLVSQKNLKSMFHTVHKLTEAGMSPINISL